MPSKQNGSQDSVPTPQDEVRRKFREALDRKNQQHTDGVDEQASGPAGGVHDAHGPAHVQRQFRRKSGG